MAPRGLLTTLRDQFRGIPNYSGDLSRKTAIVVGANVGLGYEAARKFAAMNPQRLILACRSQERGDKAVRSIKESTGCSTIECWTVDLANFESISAFADRFEKEGGGRLDVLLENAGVLNTAFLPTVDGWENTMQVNHLGTTLLALLLLPHLVATPGPPRITIVASEMHFWVRNMDEFKADNVLKKLNDPTGMNISKASEKYSITKLFNVFFARSLAAHLKPSIALSVNSMNPGWCRSTLHRGIPWPLSIIEDIFTLPFARSTEVGARTLVHAALWGTKDDVNGKFLNNSRVEEESDFALSKEGRELEVKIWKETLDVLQEVDPRVKGILAEYCQ